VTPEELAPLLYAAGVAEANRNAPAMLAMAHSWEELAAQHPATAAMWLAAAREALARLGGGQEAGDMVPLLMLENARKVSDATYPRVDGWRARAGLGDGHG
jgi:hypothetical protein